jgi:5'-deoxynucleotidase YfbR-like HD superfamily hydrolase
MFDTYGGCRMANSDFTFDLTLDDLIEEAHTRYQNLVVDGVELLTPLRLSSERRAEFNKLWAEASKERSDEDAVLFYADVIRTVAEDSSKADTLIEKIGDDLSVLTILIERYFSVAQPGEASPSQN